MLVSEGGKAMQSGENVLSAIRHDGTGNYAVNLARQGWDALGKGMHNVGHSLEERRQGMESPRFRLAGCETGRECRSF